MLPFTSGVLKVSLQHGAHNGSCGHLSAKERVILAKIPEDVVLTCYWFCSAHQVKTPQDAVSFRCAWAVEAKYSFLPNKVE